MFVLVHIVSISDDAPRSERRRKTRLRNAMHKTLCLETMCNELRDGDECQVVLLRERFELRATSRTAVLCENFADHAGGKHTSEARQVNGRLRMSYTLQHAAFACTKWKDMSTMTEI